MGKTFKGKAKAEAKIAKAKRKIARKCKGCAAVVAALSLAVLCGCSTAESAQPAKANTMSNTFDDCIIVVATHCSISNRIVTAEGTKDIPAVELFTQTQSLESSGTESFAQSNKQTPTTDVKPDVDLHYNDAIGAGGSAAKSFTDSLSTAGLALLSDYVRNKKSGTITLEKKDGTTETLECVNGSCTLKDGTVLDGDTCKGCFDTAK